MNLISSAQNQEDVMLWRALGQIENGFYIDVGAADPVEDSVTRLFYDHGWNGINLEPNPTLFARLERDRPRDINLLSGAGAKCGSMAFHVVEDTGLSTFNADIAAHYARAGRPMSQHEAGLLTLAEICRLHRPAGPIHFLKIDVEGSEQAVLAGADFQTFRPWILLVEATVPMSQEQCHAQWEPILTGQGYQFVWFDGLNRFYLADEMKARFEHCFQVQPNIFDGFGVPADFWHRLRDAEQMRDTRTGEREAMARALSIRSQERDEAVRSCDEATQNLHDAKAALAGALRRAEIAESWSAALMASTSWRITAPMRWSARLRARPAGPVPAQKVPSGASRAITGKAMARRWFRRAVHAVRTAPGGSRLSRIVYSAAPGPVEWLARRYHAYERQAEAPVIAGFEAARLDALSQAEMQICRQIANYAHTRPQ